ncbi:MAG: class II aldolase/adducin family protein [Clostridiales bacterium]|nr:class II aldolase/adducin family protein [Clostridiales bacterium]
MRFHLLHPADQLVMIMQRIYQYGMTTTSGGNLSIRDQNGDVWITPSGIDKGSLSRDDMIRVTSAGEIIGPHRPSVELPFHLDIYRRRSDLSAILHAHPPTMVAFSLARRIPNIRLIPDVLQVCGEVAMAAYAVPGSDALGHNIAEQFALGYNTVMLENHGCVIGASDLFSAFMSFETLDFCGRLEIDAKKLGTPQSLTQEQIDMRKHKRHPQFDEFIPKAYSSRERAVRRDMCKFIQRAYDQRLFTSTQGTFSHRLGGDSLVITPYNKDRKYLEPEDLVLIRGDFCEAGKQPSRSARLHSAIYQAHPDVGCVIIAHAPAIMAFAVTDAVFDSRIIPESYINLRTVNELPYFSSTNDIEGTVRAISPRTPVVVIQNECVLVTGADLLNAFDRLEVLEYSARALIDAQDIGPMVMISDEQVREIDQAFNLK